MLPLRGVKLQTSFRGRARKGRRSSWSHRNLRRCRGTCSGFGDGLVFSFIGLGRSEEEEEDEEEEATQHSSRAEFRLRSRVEGGGLYRAS